MNTKPIYYHIRCDNEHCKREMFTGDTPKLLRTCGGCYVRYYCSRKCQKVHWKAEHRRSCMYEERVRLSLATNLKHDKCCGPPCFHEIDIDLGADFIFLWKDALHQKKDDDECKRIKQQINEKVTDCTQTIMKLGNCWMVIPKEKNPENSTVLLHLA